MKTLFADFYAFLKTGKTQVSNSGFKQNAIELGKFFLLFEILVIAAIIITVTFAIIVKPPKNETLKWVTSLSPVWAFLIPNVIGPLVEEFSFRYWLKATKLTLSISSLFASYILSNDIINSSYYRIDSTFISELAISFSVAAIVYGILSVKKVLPAIQRFCVNNSHLLTWISILWFAFAHVKNFPLEGWQYLYSPLMVLPQLAMGTVLAFGRIKYGILFPIIVHILHNIML